MCMYVYTNESFAWQWQKVHGPMQENIACDVLKSPQKPSLRIASIETNSSSSVVVPLSKVSSNGATKSNNLQRNLGI